MLKVKQIFIRSFYIFDTLMLRNTFIHCILFLLLCSCSIGKKTTMTQIKNIDFQGHRGCRGLLPENTIPAFIKALEYVQTLECDVVISKDKQVIVSHDPWMEAHLCSHPDGRPLSEAEDKTIKIMQLDYDDIKQYDCGLRGHAKFPDQVPLASWYDVYTPQPKEYADLVIKELHELGITDRCNLQSFDVNLLEEIHKRDSKIVLAYLVENLASFERNMKKLSFTPDIYSPY